MSKPPLLLGIDTSGSEGSLAIARLSANGDVEAVLRVALTGRHYSDFVVTRLKDLLTQAQVGLADLSAIVIVHGPGSFTGLRVGIGAAKAVAEAAGLPVMAVSRLALLAGSTDAAAVLDAGRGEFYLRRPLSNESAEESVESAASLAEATRGMTIRICEAQLVEPLAALSPVLVAIPDALDAIRLAAPRFLVGSFDDVATLDANYVRRAYGRPANVA